MATLLTVDEVKARIDWDLDAGEEKLCLGYLETLSDDARYYAGKEWAAAEDAPPRVRNLILAACVRSLRNPDGASQSRAGDETLMWENRRNEKAGWAYFVDSEIAELRGMGSGSGYSFGAIQTFAWTDGTGRKDLTIGTTPDHVTSFPWIAKEDEVYW